MSAPELTPSERAALREWFDRKHRLDPEDTLPRDVLRLLDEADRLREERDEAREDWRIERSAACQYHDEAQQAALDYHRARRWARAWKAAAKLFWWANDVTNGQVTNEMAKTTAVMKERNTARAEANALRARVAELEGEVGSTDDDGWDPHCFRCNRRMTIVRPGKWQCDNEKCEGC